VSSIVEQFILNGSTNTQRLSSFLSQVSHTTPLLYSLSSSTMETTKLPIPTPLPSDPPPPTAFKHPCFSFSVDPQSEEASTQHVVFHSSHHVFPWLYHSSPGGANRMQSALNTFSSPLSPARRKREGYRTAFLVRDLGIFPPSDPSRLLVPQGSARRKTTRHRAS
jgi:hypothetical protein